MLYHFVCTTIITRSKMVPFLIKRFCNQKMLTTKQSMPLLIRTYMKQCVVGTNNFMRMWFYSSWYYGYALSGVGHKTVHNSLSLLLLPTHTTYIHMSSLCSTALSFSLLFALLFVSHLTQGTVAQKPTEISPYMTAEVAVVHQPYAPFSGGFFDSRGNFFFTLGDSSYLYVTDLLGTNVKVWSLTDSPDYTATAFTLNSKLMGGTVSGNKVYGVFARNNVAGESVILSLDMSSPNLIKKVQISSVFFFFVPFS